GVVVLWNLRAYHRIGEMLSAESTKSTQAAFGADPNTIVSCSEDKLLFWDVANGKPDGEPAAAAQNGVRFFSLAPDRATLVTVGQDNSVKLWNVAQRRPIKTL